MSHRRQFVPVDYKSLPANTIYDKKLHDQMVKDPNVLNALLKASGSGMVDLKRTPGKLGITVSKVSTEVSIDGVIPIITNQPFPSRYGEYNNFILMAGYNVIFLRYSN